VQRLGLAQHLRPAAGDVPAELAQRPQRGRAAGAVRHQAVLPLQPAQRALGALAEHAVRAAGVEAELEQPLLQRRDVVTDVRPGGQRQQPVPEPPAGGGQRGVRLRPDDAVHRQPAPLLELAQRLVRGLVEQRRPRPVQQPEAGQQGGDLEDRRPGVASRNCCTEGLSSFLVGSWTVPAPVWSGGSRTAGRAGLGSRTPGRAERDPASVLCGGS
jgi:hypothetical protein